MLIDRSFFDKDLVGKLPVATCELNDLYLDGGEFDVLVATCFCSEIEGCGNRIIAISSKERNNNREINVELYMNFYDNDEEDNYDEDHYEFTSVIVNADQSFDNTLPNGMNLKYNFDSKELTLTNSENKSYTFIN